MKKQDEFPAPELPEDPEARRELARQFDPDPVYRTACF